MHSEKTVKQEETVSIENSGSHQRCSMKKDVLKNSQNSQEGLQDFVTGVFLRILRTF